MTRRRFVQSATALVTQKTFAVESMRPLKDLAAKNGILFGAAVLNSELQDPARSSVVLANCSVLTPTGQLKWDTLRPSPSTYNFNDSDFFVNFCITNNLVIHGHTLVWYQGLPSWAADYINDKNAAQILSQHMQTVLGRYRGRIKYWDVVNEVISPKSSHPGLLRDSLWLRTLGSDYIAMAFHLAHELDPNALLTWNEDDLESATEYSLVKRHAVLHLLTDLRKRGVPVGALGVQAHLKPAFQKDNGDWAAFLHEVRQLGVQLLISELDVIDTHIDNQNRDAIVAGLYSDFLSVALPACQPSCVQVWEMSDRRNWLDRMPQDWQRPDGLPHRPAMLDDAYRPKPAWFAVQKSLEQTL